MHKFLDSLSTTDDEANYIIQRYADNLLLESEAINQISGPTAAAYAPINRRSSARRPCQHLTAGPCHKSCV